MNQDLAVALSKNMTALLPTFVFVMSCMTVADKAARAMFYNCDKDMLHYACYRTPQVILKNFRIRLMRISLYSIIIAGAVCAAGAVYSSSSLYVLYISALLRQSAGEESILFSY